MDPITLITTIQSLGAWLEGPSKFFSFLGSEDFFLLFLPLVYWTIDAVLGLRLGFILLSGFSLNQYFKLAFHSPRPYWVSADVRGLASETGYGLPSAHAQGAVNVWGMVAWYYRKTWVWVAAILLILLIGLSRLYLGMHFLQDTLVGWVLGFLTLWIVVKFWEPVEKRVKQLSFWNQVGLAFVVTAAMVLLGALIAFLTRNIDLPAEWIVNATRDGNEAPAPYQFSMEALLTSAGTLFGLFSGLAWITPRGGFDASGPVWKRAARFIVGLIGVAIFYAGLKAVFPSGDTFVPYLFRYIRYTFVGFWVSGGAPWIFARLNLSNKENK